MIVVAAGQMNEDQDDAQELRRTNGNQSFF